MLRIMEYQIPVQGREAGLETDDAEGRLVKASRLLLRAVRCMVRDDAVDGAVLDALEERMTVLGAADRRVHLPSAGLLKIHIRKHQIVRTGLRRHMRAGFLRRTDDLDGFLRRDVADMVAHTGLRGETYIALDLLPLRRGVDADMVVQTCILTVMDAAARYELTLILAVCHDHTVEVLRPLHRLPHRGLVLHALSVIGVGNDIRCDLLHLSERTAAGLLLGDGAIRVHMHQRILPDRLELRLQVREARWCRLQIRHRADRGIAAMRRGIGAGADRFLIRKTGLTQMYMYINEARNHEQTV